MSRGLSATVNTYLANQSQIVIGLIEINTPSGVVRYTDAPFDFTTGGNTYSAQGSFLGVSDIEESTDVVITKCNIVLSALTPSNLTTFAVPGIINKSIEISVAFVNPIDNTLIADPIVTFAGKITGYKVTDAKNTATITLEVASQFADFEKVNGRRTNEENFRVEFPNDRGMEFAHETTEGIQWGKYGN